MALGLPKPSRTARKKAHVAFCLARAHDEQREKAKVRRRDKGCRFPLCGCKKLGLAAQVSHDWHKSMGGNPLGDRSTADQMVQLCVHRHQFGAVSRHKGTLRARCLTADGYNGPVAWDVTADILWPALYELLDETGMWAEVARELAPGLVDMVLLTAKQRALLARLAEMDL